MYEVIPHNNCTYKKYVKNKTIYKQENSKIRILTQESIVYTFNL